MSERFIIARRKGFTLVELLVVIGIIALLISILLPSLRHAQMAAERTACLSGQRQIADAWMMYTQDNKGYLPSGWPDGSSPNSKSGTSPNSTWFVPWFLGASWGPGNGNTIQAIQKGAVYQYLRNTRVFKCPGDKGLRFVSYGVNCYLSGENFGVKAPVTVYKISQVRHPAVTFITIDEHDVRGGDAAGYNLGSFAIEPKGSLDWVDYPGMFHGYASGISFLDGHADVLIWDLYQTRHLNANDTTARNNHDILKLQMYRGGPEVD